MTELARVRSMLLALGDELARRIPPRLRAAAGTREVYGFALAYYSSGFQPILVPELAIGFVDERDRILREDRYGRESIWDPRQMYGPMREEDDPALCFDDGDIIAAVDGIEFRDDDVRVESRRILIQVARTMNENGFEGVTTAPSFVVYAADFDRGKWAADIEECGGSELTATLRQMGHLRRTTLGGGANADPIVERLGAINRMETEAEAREFDELLATFGERAEVPPELLESLLLVFSDDTAHHEVMSGLIHLIEHHFELEVEAAVLCASFDTMQRLGAREWADRLLKRMVNAPAGREALVAALRFRTEPSVVESIRRFAERKPPLGLNAKTLIDAIAKTETGA